MSDLKKMRSEYEALCKQGKPGDEKKAKELLKAIQRIERGQ